MKDLPSKSATSQTETKAHLPSSEPEAKRHSEMSSADEDKNNRTDKNGSTKCSETAEKTTVKSDEAIAVTFPQIFEVKYLGRREAGGLWGIKHTRRPVDEMVASAKEIKVDETLPFLKLVVSEKGVNVTEMPKNLNKNFDGGFYPIEVISYGVQDLVYTRVFAMIVVQETSPTITTQHPFHCHAFVCDSRHNARHLTFALAQAFQQFSKQIKEKSIKPKKFAIDLRSPEEKEADLKEMDSEA